MWVHNQRNTPRGNNVTLPSPSPVIRAAILLHPGIIEHMSEDALKLVKAAGYDGIRTVMHAAIESAIYTFLSGTGYAATYRDRMAAAVSQAYVETADAAYIDGGGDLPMDEDTAAWAREKLAAQLGFIDDLFEQLKEIRKEGDFDADLTAAAKADSYASALDGFYNEGSLRGSKNQVVEWILGSTEKHCKDCAKLDGQRHKISWFLDRDYIPRKNGAAMECGGWNCDCRIVDRSGNEITI
jgi:hypothetical protein